MNPEHDYFSDKIDGTWVCIIFLAFAVIAQLDNLACTYRCFDRMNCSKNHALSGLDVDEKLGTYWSNLSAYDQKLWYACETYKRNVLKIKTISDENLEILRTDTSNKERTIVGFYNYEIL
jgi:hypothetical protein